MAASFNVANLDSEDKGHHAGQTRKGMGQKRRA